MLKRPLILQISTLLKLKLKCSQNTAKKPSQFKNFPADMFLFGVRKNNLHCIISWCPRTTFLEHLESKYMYVSVYLSKKILFQRPTKILSGGMGVGGGWIISLRGLSTLLKLKLQCSQNTAKKPFQFTNFPADMFLFGVRKKICIASFPGCPRTISWNTLKANICMFLYISLRKIYFKDLARFCCLGLVKYFTIFHFSWNFLKFNNFSVFQYFHQ